jgi:hypothetical protein
MAKSEIVLMSKSGYAKHLGISETAIRKAITEGKIVKGWNAAKGKINKDVADIEYGFLHIKKSPGQPLVEKPSVKSKQVQSKPEPDKVDKSDLEEKFEDMFEGSTMTVGQIIKKINIHPGLTYNEAMRRKIILELCSDFMKIEKEQGELVRKSDIDKALYAFGAIMKRALLNIPNRIMDNLRAADTKVEAMNLLRDEINGILTSVSKHQNLKISND